LNNALLRLLSSLGKDFTLLSPKQAENGEFHIKDYGHDIEEVIQLLRMVGIIPYSLRKKNKLFLLGAGAASLKGHHIQQRTLRQYANSVLKATDRDATASRYWARRFLRRYSQFFHKRKSQTLSAQRKAMSDRGNIQEWFRKWNIFTENEENDIDFENVWNVDETGFQIGYLKNGIFLWTFGEVEEPILTDAHETTSVTIVESISAKGQVIPPFIMPGVQIPSRWVDNGLEGEAAIATTPKGYIGDVTAQDYFDHFERHTRPQNGQRKRVLLLDGCENHFTKELHHKAQVAGVVLYPFPPHLTHMLQPLDVGMFSLYKHWHQEVLQREIADGATDFNKADFLFHLQEIRRKATKRSTIISSWKKTGIYPFNPSAVLDRMVDPLSSLSLEAAEADLPGYISAGDSSPKSLRHTPVTKTPNQTRKTSANSLETYIIRTA
jgi:hypothetical protein